MEVKREQNVQHCVNTCNTQVLQKLRIHFQERTTRNEQMMSFKIQDVKRTARRSDVIRLPQAADITYSILLIILFQYLKWKTKA
jgi:hypothetical protein